MSTHGLFARLTAALGEAASRTCLAERYPLVETVYIAIVMTENH